MNYQRVWAEINLDHIAHNIKEVKKRLQGHQTSIIAIVKADGYGHGAVEVAKVLLFNGADCLGVAICDEGIALRENNIHVPILVLGYTPEPKLHDVVKHKLIQTVFSYEMAERLSEAALKLGCVARVHIKIDTGMSRLGFIPNDSSLVEILNIQKLSGIEISGIYTHFALSDVVDETFTNEQYEQFKLFIDTLSRAGLDIPCKHVSNSGAMVGHGGVFEDAVRPGIILYGLNPSVEEAFGEKFRQMDFKAAMSLKTQISYTKHVGENISVGYGRSFFTKRKTVIGTIPVGYADGYLRAMGNRGRVLVGGQFAPIIGNICMDQFMVDITDIERVNAGDEVVLIGSQGAHEITVDEVASLQGTINYEVVCNIGKRVPRVYLKNNETIRTINYI